MEEENKNLENELNNTNMKISVWIEKGKSLMFSERLEEWQNCVEARANAMFNGKDLDIALEIIEKLNNGATLAEAKELLDLHSHAQSLYAMVLQIIFAFSKQGPEFLEYVMNGDISIDTRKAIETKRRENIRFELATQVENSKEVSTETIQNSPEINQVKNDAEDIEHKTESIENDTPIGSNNYLAVRKENIFTKIVNLIRNFFFSKRHKKDAITDN